MSLWCGVIFIIYNMYMSGSSAQLYIEEYDDELYEAIIDEGYFLF